jgi:Domain of unknown function (DUF4032)/Lipopolysaccharide kinase (Kdo/WaaP) family
MALQITAIPDDPALLDLPWSTALEDWPADQLVALPRGISRHVVRFVRITGKVYAIKEVPHRLAQREFDLLRRLERRDVPAVEAVGVITGRETPDGESLETALITRHLQFSLPYRALFSKTLRPVTANRLLDALAVLLVRLHLTGFSWGDCSLSNTLFRRDAGAFAAYLVDAETGEMHPRLSEGQRRYDVDLAGTNIAGELMDLQSGGLLEESIDPIDTGLDIADRYIGLWDEITGPSVFGAGERYRFEQRLRRLNELGFDVAEVHMTAEQGGSRVVLTPKVVDAGHHTRRLLRLTGLDVQENQARRLLNDIDTYRAVLGAPEEDEEIVAHRWLNEVFEPVVRSVPRDLRRKLEPAEVFHEVLEHRWYLSEAAGRDIGLGTAAQSYIDNVLAHKPNEKAVLGRRIGPPSSGYTAYEDFDTTELPPIVG